MGRKKTARLLCLLFVGLLCLWGCSSPSSDSEEITPTVTLQTEVSQNVEVTPSEEENKGLVFEKRMDLQYAENFTIDCYEGGYRLLTIKDGTKLFVVPEGKDVPEEVDPDAYVIKQPVKNLYLVATAIMDMFDTLDALDTIRLSGQKEGNWYIESANAAMENGDMIYAGKYNKPDYELLVAEECSLAIENMMISHSPEVIEMLQSFEIPAMIEYSSYESHPMGRVEWVKFFGTLVGKEAEAEKAFAEQLALLEQVTVDEKTEKTIAFFFITSNGLVQVRVSSDYVPKMIELAGGKYIFENGIM